MKSVLIYLLLIFAATTLFAQNPEKFEEGKIKIGQDLYEVGVIKRSNSIAVANLSKNIQPDPPSRDNPEPARVMPWDIHFNTETVEQIVFEILAEKLHQLREHKEFIRISYGFSPQGKAINLGFVLSDSTSIAPVEIALIDDRIRKELTATFTDDLYKTQKIIFAKRQSINF